MQRHKHGIMTMLILLLFITTVSCIDNNKEENSQQQQQWSIFVQQVIAYITKMGLKILVSPKLLKAQIKIIVQKLIKVSLTKSALKKIPVVGGITGIGLGIWRYINGQNYRAWAEIASGLSGATGLGIGWSLAIDVGILIADVVEELIKLGYVG